MTSAPTYPQTHPNLPKGKEQVTPNIGFCFYIKVVVTPHIDIQPPPNLPRRGGRDTIGYLIITHGNLIITHGNLIITHSNLIIGDLSLTRVTCIQQSLTKQSICPSPSGEARWGLKRLTEFSSRVTVPPLRGRLGGG